MKTILTALVVTLLTFVLHEGAHALAAKFLEYEVLVSINHVTAVGGYEKTSHMLLVSLAGPLATLLQGALGAIVARAGKSLTAFLVVFAALFHRALAQAVSVSSPNDEMRVSAALDIGPWTLPAAFVALLFVLTAWASRGPKPGWAEFALAFAGAGAGVAAAVLGEPLLPAVRW